jgi:hypothetical protein
MSSARQAQPNDLQIIVQPNLSALFVIAKQSVIILF